MLYVLVSLVPVLPMVGALTQKLKEKGKEKEKGNWYSKTHHQPHDIRLTDIIDHTFIQSNEVWTMFAVSAIGIGVDDSHDRDSSQIRVDCNLQGLTTIPILLTHSPT